MKNYRLNCYLNNETTFYQDYANFFDASEFLEVFKEQCEKNDNVIDVKADGVSIDARYYINIVTVTTKDNNIIKFEIVGI